MRIENYQPQLIQEIKTRIDLTKLIRKYTAVNGRNKAICLFHPDRNPSLSITQDNRHWECFSCGKKGDAIDFLMLVESLSFPAAVRHFANELGISLDNSQIDKKLQSKWEERQKRLEAIDDSEDLFKDLENDLYAHFREKISKLPPKLQRDAKDYNKEVSIEMDLDCLDDLVGRRVELFKKIREVIRNEI